MTGAYDKIAAGIADAIYMVSSNQLTATVYFPAIVESAMGSFGVYFPDLPGCVSAGLTTDEAIAGAEEALNGHLRVMQKYGDVIPRPSALADIEPASASVEVRRLLVRGQLLHR